MINEEAPTYQNLLDFIPHFIEEEIDIRVFRNPKKNFRTDNIPMFYVGDYPVEKQYRNDTIITNEFITTEIQKIKDQWDFDRTVKPYPYRDLYYTILINDLKDLLVLSKHWTQCKKTIVKGIVPMSGYENINIQQGGGGGGSDYYTDELQSETMLFYSPQSSDSE